MSADLQSRPDRGDVIDALDNPAAVFVYGTLLQGEPLHGAVRGYVRTVHEATLADFALYGGGAFPYGVPTTGAITRGQVLTFTVAVHRTVLDVLDRIEGYPDHYDRKVMVAACADGTLYPAWVYFVHQWFVGDMARVPNDDWRCSAARSRRWPT